MYNDGRLALFSGLTSINASDSVFRVKRSLSGRNIGGIILGSSQGGSLSKSKFFNADDGILVNCDL